LNIFPHFRPPSSECQPRNYLYIARIHFIRQTTTSQHVLNHADTMGDNRSRMPSHILLNAKMSISSRLNSTTYRPWQPCSCLARYTCTVHTRVSPKSTSHLYSDQCTTTCGTRTTQGTHGPQIDTTFGNPSTAGHSDVHAQPCSAHAHTHTPTLRVHPSTGVGKGFTSLSTTSWMRVRTSVAGTEVVNREDRLTEH
jgi:hypothetical protein